MSFNVKLVYSPLEVLSIEFTDLKHTIIIVDKKIMHYYYLAALFANPTSIWLNITGSVCKH